MAQFGLIFCKTAQNSTHVAFLASSLKRASVRRGANTSSPKHRDMRRGSGMGAQAVCLSCSKKPLPGSRVRSIWRAQGIWPARAYARMPGRQLVLRPPGHRVRAAVRPSSPLARTRSARTPGRQLVLRTSARTHSATSPKCLGCVLVWLAAVGACTMESTPTGSSR